MAPDTPFDPRISIWDTWRQTVLALGHQLHERLRETVPVTIHGRDLRHEDEGVGFQFQYMLTGDQAGADARAAFYVLQLQLKKRAPSIGWEVDAIPVIERGDGSYQLHERRTFSVPLRRHDLLASVITNDVAADAAAFFDAVTAGRPFTAEPLTVPGAAGGQTRSR